MKTLRLIAVFAFAAIFAVSAFAQTQTTPATFRIAVINTAAFDDDKGGLSKYVTAANSLETEFKPLMAELQTMATRYQALQTELQTAQANAQKNPNVPIDTKSLQSKADEFEKLGRELKFKQEDAKARYERREAAVLTPIRLDIGNAIQEFTKQKGYAMVLDAAKLDGAGLLLGFDEKYDVTKEFITFYNSRPAATATATKP